jgi:hypothetical protein
MATYNWNKTHIIIAFHSFILHSLLLIFIDSQRGNTGSCLHHGCTYNVSLTSQNNVSSEIQGLDGSAAFGSRNGSYSWYCSFQVT